jgi:mannose-6-phosphate isomerase-like protein (cupin superfamily)
MNPAGLDLILKRFDAPDETRTFDKGRFELVRLAGMTIGRATYEPGWVWSKHVQSGTPLCQVEHVGMVLAGRAAVKMADGRTVEMTVGDLFYVGAGHDSWVVGEERYVSLHFLGSEHYALPGAPSS